MRLLMPLGLAVSHLKIMEDEPGPYIGGGGIQLREPLSPRYPFLSRQLRRTLPLLLGRAATRRRTRSPLASSATEIWMEEWRRGLGSSRSVAALDLVWNLASVLVCASVLLGTARERPSTPIRAWVIGYAAQCLLHVVLVCSEYRRRHRRGRSRWAGDGEDEGLEESREGSAVKKLESLNVIFSFLWWILGFYWIIAGGKNLLQDAPHLYWLAVVLLAFGVFFAIFCITLAYIIGMAFCCCLPCILLFLYAVASQEGASDADLCSLPKFRFCRVNQSENMDIGNKQTVSVTATEPVNSEDDLALPPEDSECCICLTQYEDGVELHSLPCNHHFHSACIIKWLRINATCPLCKYNILTGDNTSNWEII